VRINPVNTAALRVICSALLVSFLFCFTPALRAAEDEEGIWFARKYAENFVQSYFPSNAAIMKMDIWGFFYLWGVISFIDGNLPEGLDGAKYAVLVRDLRKEIEFLQRDMLYLLKEVWGVRKIDRAVINVQMFSIMDKLKSIISNVQRVRTNLIKPAYFLFNNSLDHTIYINNSFDFSVGLDYLSGTSIWSSWRSRAEITREIEVAKKLGVNTVKIGVFLDDWIYKNTARVNDIRENLALLKSLGFKLYINFMGVRGWYGDELSFKPRSGRACGSVNFLTWRYHCEQAIAEVVKEFQPEYISVMKEPFIDFQEQLDETVPVELWLDCFKTIAEETARSSPATCVVLENTLSTPADIDLFKKFQELKPRNIAFGALVYSLKDIFSYNQYSKNIRIKKRTIVAEFWDSAAIYIDEYAEEFIYLVFRWALNKKINFINLSHIVNLHTYDFKNTPAFYRYKNIITMAFMEGICKKGVRAESDGIYGNLYESYGQTRLDYSFSGRVVLRERSN